MDDKRVNERNLFFLQETAVSSSAVLSGYFPGESNLILA